MACWQRQKAKLGLGEGFEGRGQGAVPPGLLPEQHFFNSLLEDSRNCSNEVGQTF